jgi:hypothetical protein
MKVVPLRLTPGDDLRQALETWMADQEEQAGCVISAVGSVLPEQPRPRQSTASSRSSAWPERCLPMASTSTLPLLTGAAP